MTITEHAKKRMKERCGFNKKTAERMAQKAFYEGITHAQSKGNLKKWITSLYFKNINANNIRVYGENYYIFNCKDRLPEEKINPITQDFYEYQVTFQSEDVKDIRH